MYRILCNFDKVNNSLSTVDWYLLFPGLDVSSCFSMLKSKVADIALANIPLNIKRQC